MKVLGLMAAALLVACAGASKADPTTAPLATTVEATTTTDVPCETRTTEMLDVMDVVFTQVQAANGGVPAGADEFIATAVTFPEACDTTELLLHLNNELASPNADRASWARTILPAMCDIWKDRGSAAAQAACP